MWLLHALGCAPTDSPPPDDTGPAEAPWSRELPDAREISVDGGFSVRRAITHLHSPWSHDACDGDPLPDGLPNAACLADLRAGLCATRVDAAFLSDHPAEAAFQPYADLFLAQPGDTPWPDAPTQRANQIHCDDGHVVTWFPGIEDETMPLGLDRHVSLDSAVNDATYNAGDAAAVIAETEAGALVFMAHTEQRDYGWLAERQAAGMVGVELFNLHAMFDPDIRADYLGLDGLGWLADIGPFADPSASAEPDLLVLAVLAEQPPSIANWDGLLANGPTVGIAGTDAHQNVLPTLMRDGERGDSYRRMLRWFSNHLLVAGDDPADLEDALAAGRSYVAFEILGTPTGFSFHYGDVQMGGEGPAGGTLHVACPTLLPGSPRGPELPEITATVFRDGQPWQTGCGDFADVPAGVYRVRIDMVPHQLVPFLGEDPTPWVHGYPWVYGNAIRVTRAGA
jgi:hypothetical protein